MQTEIVRRKSIMTDYLLFYPELYPELFLEIRNYRLSNLDLFLTGSEGADNEPVYERIADSNSGVQSDERPVTSVEQQRLTSFLPPPPPNIKVLPPGRLAKTLLC